MRIVNTDNFGGDYPDEFFVDLPPLEKDLAKRLCEAINDAWCPDNQSPRYWRVVDDDYVLVPGFEP